MIVDFLGLNAFDQSILKFVPVFEYVWYAIILTTCVGCVYTFIATKNGGKLLAVFGMGIALIYFYILIFAIHVQNFAHDHLAENRVVVNKSYFTKESLIKLNSNSFNVIRACIERELDSDKSEPLCSIENKKIIFENIYPDVLDEIESEAYKVGDPYRVNDSKKIRTIMESAANGIISKKYSGFINSPIERKVEEIIWSEVKFLDLTKQVDVERFAKFVEFYESGCGRLSKESCEAVRVVLVNKKTKFDNYDAKKEVEALMKKIESGKQI